METSPQKKVTNFYIELVDEVDQYISEAGDNTIHPGGFAQWLVDKNKEDLSV